MSLDELKEVEQPQVESSESLIIDLGDRYSRQSDLVPIRTLQSLTVTVIGTGAVGRHLALELAAMGARSIRLIDHDHIELTNVTTQGWPHAAIGRAKVRHLREEIVEIDPQCLVAAVEARYDKKWLSRYWREDPLQQVYFVAVDSIAVRTQIWEDVQESVQFLTDGRMLSEVVRVLATDSSLSNRRRYSESLFAAEEAQTGRCTAQSTIYSATICAGLMLHQFARWLRGYPAITPDTLLNLEQSFMEPLLSDFPEDTCTEEG